MLNNHVAIVVGAAGQIGRVLASAIIEQGGSVAAADLESALDTECRNYLASVADSAKHLSLAPVDIRSKASMQALIESAHERFGRIDSVVNCAYPRNSNYGRIFEEVEYEDFCDNVSGHLGGCFLVAQQAISYFRRQGHGNLINFASVYGVIAPRFEIYEGTAMTMPVEYAAIKAAVIHVGRYLARCVKGQNIRVNTVSPGGVFAHQPDKFVNRYSHFTLSNGMLNSSDIVGAVLFLMSDMSKHVNGQNIVVDDGFTL